jgi:predicted SAM-dependent methyltransferase
MLKQLKLKRMEQLKNFLIRIVKFIFKKSGYSLVRVKNDDESALYIRLYGEDSVKNRSFYNLSAGAYLGFGGGLHHPYWTNIDLNKQWDLSSDNPKIRGFDPKKDIEHDLLSMKPLPLANSSADLVYTRFTIPSLTDEAALFMFCEVFRVLKNNGVFRISTPDIDLDYRAYFNNDRSFFYWFSDYTKVSIEQAFLFHVASQVSAIHHDGAHERIMDEQFRNLLKTRNMEDALNFCASKCSVEKHKRYRQNHINWWNAAKLEKMLSRAGFKTIYVSTRGQSGSPVMRNETCFDNEDNKFVMYMEAVKLI